MIFDMLILVFSDSLLSDREDIIRKYLLRTTHADESLDESRRVLVDFLCRQVLVAAALEASADDRRRSLDSLPTTVDSLHRRAYVHLDEVLYCILTTYNSH